MTEDTKEIEVIEEPMNIKKALQAAMYGIIKENPFSGGLIQELSLTINQAVPTAYIGFDKKTMKFIMGVNPEFFLKLTHKERMAVLTHEILHFVHQHLFRMKFDEIHNSEKVLWNIAGDMAINQFINDLPEGCVKLDSWKKPDGGNLEAFKSMEYYFEQIKKSLEDKEGKDKSDKKDGKEKEDQEGQTPGDQPGQGNGKGMPKWLKDFHGRKDATPKDEKGQTDWSKGDPQSNDETFDKYKAFDEHDWESLSPDERERMLKEAKDMVQRTLEKSALGHTLLPKDLKDFLENIESMIQKLDYKGILKRAIKKSVTVQDRLSTWYRPNKRFGEFAKGTTVGKLPQINVYVDTSGSMSIRELNESIDIMSGFMKVGGKQCNLGLWHTDLYHFKKHKLSQPVDPEIFHSGGTDPRPCLEHIKATKPNLSIILTDGHYDHVDINLGDCEVIFVIRDDNNIDHPCSHLGQTIKYSALK